MLNLARNEPQPRQVGAIAAEENIPRKFLEAIMTELGRADLVIGSRGKYGGYRLARPADLITFGAVMRVADGPLALIACASPNFYRRCDDCPDEVACALRRVMIQARNEMSAILDRTSLADAMDEPEMAELGEETLAMVGP